MAYCDINETNVCFSEDSNTHLALLL